jgi:uncharacterized membrane protein YccF (DUF307 family)
MVVRGRAGGHDRRDLLHGNASLAHFTLWPFGRTTVHTLPRKCRAPSGTSWLILAGWWLAWPRRRGALCCLTMIGIPFGLQSFKLAGLLVPSGGESSHRGPQLPAGQQ